MDRNEHPEYRKKERLKYIQIDSERYKTDEVFKQKKKERALDGSCRGWYCCSCLKEEEEEVVVVVVG